jgi:hypothetical protein
MKLSKLIAILVFVFLSGCGTIEIGVEHKLNNTATAPVIPTDEPSMATPVEVPAPTAVALPPTNTLWLPTATQAAPSPTPGPQMVQIFLIALDDNGQSGQLVGCGDSAIAVQFEVPPTKEVLRASMEKLLALKELYYGESGLYNALYQSDLQLESIALVNGKATIHLTGSLVLGGVCDNPRVEAQLEATVHQFYTVQEVGIFINGTPLKDALSLK